MKAIGIGLSALSVAAFGWWKSAQLKRRIILLDAAEQLCRRIGEELRFSAAPPSETLVVLAQDSALRELTFLREFRAITPAEFHTVWQQKTAAFVLENGLDKETASLLSDFGAGLGTTDLQSQQTHCDAYAARFSGKKAAAASAYAQKGRLYVSLGGIGGVAVALILL